jgi:outer membrane immunogenic protein
MTSDIFSSTNDFNGRGGVAGGQVGCNYQDGNWVFGLEGEGYWSGIKISDTSSRIFNGVTDSIINTTLKNDSDFTIAARVGYTIDRTMIYGKGGWAWGSLKATGFNTCCFTSPPATTETFLSSGTLDGFMVGIGIEHMLTRNWTVKLEYDYIGFGNKELAATICPTPSTCVVPFSNSFSATKQIFKVGANYLFDLGGAPLVAKY